MPFKPDGDLGVCSSTVLASSHGMGASYDNASEPWAVVLSQRERARFLGWLSRKRRGRQTEREMAPLQGPQS